MNLAAIEKNPETGVNEPATDSSPNKNKIKLKPRFSK